MKFYRYGMNFYKVMENKHIKVIAYKHCQAIEIESSFDLDMEELEEITEAQFNRIKRLILKKLI
jgi:hypothetical protein